MTLFSRRELLARTGTGLGVLGLAALFGDEARANPLAPRQPHFPPRARRVIHVYLNGGPSQVDTFDFKPTLQKLGGQPFPDSIKAAVQATKHSNVFHGCKDELLASPFAFAQHGQSGAWVSELLPHMARHIDDLCLLHSLQADSNNHAPASYQLHTGDIRPGKASLGSWVSYGLGTENENLPAFVVLVSGALPGGGGQMWGPGFLPGVHQGVEFRSGSDPVLFLGSPPGHERSDRRRLIDTIGELEQAHLEAVGDPAIATRIRQYELAFRMQTSVPELNDLALTHDGDAVGHGQRLLLVVGHEQERHAELLMEALELHLHPLPELEIERTQRLVEQEHVRPVDDGPRERDALLLPT